MAEVLLSRPESGSQVTVECPEGANFKLDFPGTEATLARDENDLNITLGDGSQIKLQDFYNNYNSEENLPSFNVDGTEITAQEFFTAMGAEDLMPAMGPGGGTGAAGPGGGRFHQYDDLGLVGGIEHLNGLDWGMNRAFEWDPDLNSVGRHSDDEGWGAYQSTGTNQGIVPPVAPVEPGTPVVPGQPLQPGQPSRPAPSVNNPVTVVPTVPGDFPVDTPEFPAIPGMPDRGAADLTTGRDVLRVHEKGLRPGSDIPVSVDGSMDITAPDGVDTITIGGVTVWENGAIVPGVAIHTPEGTLSNINFDPSTGKLTYTYTLENSTDKHGEPGEDNIAENFPVVVTDPDGDSDTSTITIIITDDIPEAVDDEASARAGSKAPVTGNVLDNDDFGADGPHADSYVTLDSDPQGEYGVITFNPDGTWSFELDQENPEVKGLKPGETLTQTYEYTITDADGDTSTATLTITITGNNPVTVTPEHPSNPFEPENPDVPGNPDDPNDPGNPDNPDNPGTPDRPEDQDRPGDPDDPDNPLVPNPGADVDQSVLRFDEKELADGKPVTKTDTMHVEAPDGVATIEVGGKVVWENGGLVPEENRTFDTDEGHLVITGFDPDSGTLTYEFTLTNPTDEHDRPGTDNISHTFPVTVTDIDGDQGSSYITVVVKDDVPVANADRDTVAEGQTITNNVITGVNSAPDSHGQDGPGTFDGNVTVRWDVPEGTQHQTGADGRGYYEISDINGVIKLYDDGDYEFTAAHDIPGVVGDKAASLEYGYSIIDNDGDVASSTLTITITNHKPDITPDPTYPDPDNPDNPDIPDNPDPDNPDPDVPDNPDPDNPDNPDQPNNHDPVQPLGNSVHVIADEASLPNGAGAGDQLHGAAGTGSFQVNLYGESGDVTLTWTDAAGKTRATTFSLVNNDRGQVEFSPATMALANGVTLNLVNAVQAGEDGAWTVNFNYALGGAQEHVNAGAVGEADNIRNTIRIDVVDETGDKAHGSIVVDVHDDGPVVTQQAVGMLTPDTTDHADSSLAGSFAVNFGADGQASVPFQFEGKDLARTDAGWTLTTADGVLTITAGEGDSWNYSFAPNFGVVLNDRIITLDAIDSDGDRAQVAITLNVDRDPTIPKDEEDHEDSDPSGVKPELIADRVSVDEGSQPQDHEEGEAHGSGSSSFTVNMHGEGGTITIGGGVVITVNTDGTYSVAGDSVTSGNHVILSGFTASENNGEWTINYNYKHDGTQLDHAANGGDGLNVGETVSIAVKDNSGGTASSNIVVNVHDDAPIVTQQGLGTPADAPYHEGSSVAGNFAVSFGADGQAKVPFQFEGKDLAKTDAGWTLTTDDGVLTITQGAGNTWNYSFNPNLGVVLKGETITLDAIDSDGDKAPVTITLNVDRDPTIPEDKEEHEDPDPSGVKPELIADRVSVDEGSQPQDHEEGEAHGSGSSSFTVNMHGEGGTITIGGENGIVITIADDGKTVTSITGGSISSDNHVTLSNFTASVVDGVCTISYKYTHDGTAQDHDQTTGHDTNIGATIGIHAVDNSGGEASSNIVVNVHDDAPVVTQPAKGDLTTDTTDHADSSLSGAFAVSFGADGKAEVPFQFDGKNLTAKDGDWILTTDEGVLTITAGEGNSWNYSFTPKFGVVLENKKIELDAIDSDGDKARVTITLNVDRDPTIPQDKEDHEDPDPSDVKPELIADRVTVDEGSRPQDHEEGEAHGAGTSSFTVNMHGEGGTIKIGNGVTIKVDTDGKSTVMGESVSSSNHVILSGFKAEMDENGIWTISYAYRFDGTPLDHATDGDGLNIGSTVAIAVEDNSGGKASSNIVVNVHDDVPEITVSNVVYDSSHSYQITGSGHLDFGADTWESWQGADGVEHNSQQALDLTVTVGGRAYKAEGSFNEESGTWEFNLAGLDATVVLAPQDDGDFTFTYTTANSLNNTANLLEYNFKFTVTDADGDPRDSSVSCTVRPTNVLFVPDPEPTPENPSPDPLPFTPADDADVDNIIIGSSTSPMPVYNLSFLFDLTGSCSVKMIKGMRVDGTKESFDGFEADPFVAMQNAQDTSDPRYIAYTKEMVGEDGEPYTAYFFRSADSKTDNFYEYTELHNAMEQTIEYVRQAYMDAQPGTTINVLMGGFDIKMESAVEFRISCDLDGAKTIEMWQHDSTTPRLDADGKLTDPRLSQDAQNKLIWSAQSQKPDGKDVDAWLDDISHHFNESVIYNLNTAFSNGYDYTATNIDNALGYAHGWFNELKAEQSGIDVPVYNHTFLLGDGGATAYTKPVTEELEYFHNYTDDKVKDSFDLTQIKAVWVGEDAADAHWDNSIHSWSDVAWKPGQYAMLKVTGGSSGEAVIVINQLGLVTASNVKGAGLDINNDYTNFSQLKYAPGADNCSGMSKDDGKFKNSVPVVMDLVEDEATGEWYYAPCVSAGTINQQDPRYNTYIKDINNKIDMPDPESQAHTIKTAQDYTNNVSDITVIQFGHNIGDDLAQYVGGQYGTMIDDVNGNWGRLPAYLEAILPRPVDDVVDGRQGDDILFGDSLVPGADMQVENGKYDQATAHEANLGMLAAMVGMDKMDINDPAGDAAAWLWNNSDEVARQLDGNDKLAGGNDALIGGSGNDLLFGMAGRDVLMGDGDLHSLKELADQINNLEGRDGVTDRATSIVTAMQTLDRGQLEELAGNVQELEGTPADKGGNDKLYGGNDNDVLLGMEGDDLLVGGEGDDFLFGGSGDDVLIGGAGKDTMFGGSGNDLIVFDKSDYLIDGGSCIDFMVSGEAENPHTLAEMLDNYANGVKDNGPMAHDVEVLFTGMDMSDNSLTNMTAIAEKYGFSLSQDKDGRDILTLDKSKGWDVKEGGSENDPTTVYENEEMGVSIETTLVQQDSGEEQQIVLAQQQMQSDNG